MATLFDATHPPPTPTRDPRLNDDGISVAGCSIIYAPRGQAGEYSPLSTNPYRGCGHGCAYCLSPDTLIQKADGSSVPLSDIQVGDDIVGIIRSDDTCPTSRYKYAKSKVLAKLDSVKPAYRITLDNGQSSVCSADHRWLTERGWKYTDRLTTNNEIRILGTATQTTQELPLIGIAARGASRIVAIEPLGLTIAMLDITTSTENFIANGMISHNCYVPDVLRMTRKEFDSGAFPRPNFLDKLKADARKYQALGITEQVMFSFTTDVYNPFDRSLTRPSIEVLREHGLGFCVLTKGGSRALADIDLYRPDRDAFASTLTSLDDKVSKKWERGAALPGDRIATLKAFHDRGIFTWVSLEPTLDCDTSIEIVRETHKFVDLYKIGRVNYLPMTKTTDWNSYTLRMIGTLNELGARHYIKRDLQKYLPPGYPNPLRVPQHH